MLSLESIALSTYQRCANITLATLGARYHFTLLVTYIYVIPAGSWLCWATHNEHCKHVQCEDGQNSSCRTACSCSTIRRSGLRTRAGGLELPHEYRSLQT